ncbi:uncharacterized protein LOC115925076 [Strongylocentrotus purpuratus]|uniref:Uncharacterized protein n=1 Tax=Strongylocentrotus purpuratus TaxID=7668 RepID=A0A7M7P269_STRPU|nr:uncharacterized protein LOC105445581 [Strongylocentrotus purpuratus]XP_030844093.1 uncharacterized protein LOC115925076 [Strongylocentrotus purpuratus]
MTSMIKYILQVFLSIATICSGVKAQGLNPDRGVNFHLRAMCAPYQLEVAKSGHSCNSQVIDEVHDYAENVHLEGYNRELVEEYLNFAKTGQLCYGEGLTIYKVVGDCDCMSKVCDRYNPKKVDYCKSKSK